MKFLRFAAIAMVLITLLAACAPAAVPTLVPVPTPTMAPVLAPTTVPLPNTGASATTVVALTITKSALGTIVTDSAGRTLYMFAKDTKDTSVCYDTCATNWPPLLADKIDAKDGVDATLIGYTKRTDGKMQVTYNGMPLYYFAKDAKPGDTAGQNVGGTWFVLTADGKAIKPVASDTAAQTFTVLVSA